MRGYLFPSGYSLACQHLGLAISLRVPSLKRGRTSNFHPRVGHRTVISIIGITRFRLPFLSSEPTSSLPKSCIVQPKKKKSVSFNAFLLFAPMFFFRLIFWISPYNFLHYRIINMHFCEYYGFVFYLLKWRRLSWLLLQLLIQIRGQEQIP